jgi:hypothetical protein
MMTESPDKHMELPKKETMLNSLGSLEIGRLRPKFLSSLINWGLQGSGQQKVTILTIPQKRRVLLCYRYQKVVYLMRVK